MNKRNRVAYLIGVTLLASLLFTAVAVGQTGLGIVKGTVVDSTGSAVPGANLTLTQAETGVVRESQSNEVGNYQFPAVPIGNYKLTVESEGFKKYEGTFIVQAGQTVAIDPALEVGSVETVVEVSGAAPIINTVGMDLGDIKDAKRIEDLPLNGRFITNLFTLTPGVEGGGSPRVNGMKVGSTEMTLDGMSLVDRFGGGMARVQPGLDTVQEFRIETSGSNARNSRPSTITLVTKSGTNEIHGAAFWTHRNNAAGLRARKRQEGTTAAKLIRNEFGVSAGGPVIKDKLFWFAAYEGSRARQSRFASGSVQTDAMWAGDLSNAIDQNNNPLLIYNPLSTKADGTRDPFPNNTIPSTMLNDFRNGMRAITPQPQGRNAGGNPFLVENFENNYPNNTDFNQYTFKGDYNLSDKDTISARYTYDKRLNQLFGGRFGIPVPGSTDQGGTGLNDARVHNGYVRWNRVFSPALFNELQVSAHRSAKSSGTLGNDTPWADNLGLPNPFGVTGWPTLCAWGNSPFGFRRWGCWDGDNRKDENLTSYVLEDNVTWVKGNHSITFGGKARWEHNNNIQELQQAQGSHSWGPFWTAQYSPADDSAVSRTGIGFADMIMGMPEVFTNQFNRGFFYFGQWETGLYVQDQWKVTSRLTLDLGLRYDRWSPYKEKFDRMVNVDLSNFQNQFQVITPNDTRVEDIGGIPSGVPDSWANRGLSWATANSVGFPQRLLPTDNNNFAPRIGAAFRINDKTVIRGGFGLYYWTMPLSQILQAARTNPPFNLRFANNRSDLNGDAPNYSIKNVPSPEDIQPNVDVPTTGIVPITSNAISMRPWDVRDWRDNMARSWNVTFERELMKNTSLRLSYVGTQGRNLEQKFQVNSRETEWNYQARTGLRRPSKADLRRPNPDWNFSGATNHTGFSNSHLLQAQVERRFSDGLSFQWFYVFSRVLTTSDAGGFTSGNGSINATGGSNYDVPEVSQLRGAPNVNYDDRLRLGYINSANVPKHRITWNGLYDLPFGRGKKFGTDVSKGLNYVVGGWQVAFIGTWKGGNWMGVSGGRYLFGDPTLSADQRLEMKIFGKHQRLWFAGDFEPSSASDVDQTKLTQLVNPDRGQRTLRPLGSNFDNKEPQVLADGSVVNTPIGDNVNWNARNFIVGPSAFNMDFSIFKNFQFTEQMRLRFTADFFNVFNHPIDVAPNTTTGLQDLSVQGNEPRIIQFSLRFEF